MAKMKYETYLDFGTIDINIDIDKWVERKDPFGEFGDAVNRGVNWGINKFMKELRKEFINILGDYRLADSEIASNFNIYLQGDNTVVLDINSEYGVYVEMGTGIVGKYGAQHPNPPMPDWVYDIHDHGSAGWSYYDKSGKLRWTMGQESRPFLYMTWLWARQSFSNYIRQGINREIKKWGKTVS